MIYKEIESYLRENIRNEKFPPKSAIPTEKELCEMFSVSRMTVRHAIDNLIFEGLLYRVKGSGTYVSSKKIERSLEKSQLSHDSTIEQLEADVKSKVISLELTDDVRLVKDKIQCDPGAFFWKLKRVRFLDQTPVLYEIIYFPQKLLQIATKKDFEGSFADYLKRYGVDTLNKRMEVESILALPQTAKNLSISVGDPILKITIVTGTKDCANLIYSENFYLGNQFKFVVANGHE